MIAAVASTAFSPYCIAFVLTPIWFFSCALDTRRTRGAIFLIRAGSYRAHLAGIARRTLRIFIAPTLAIVAGATISVISGLAGRPGSDAPLWRLAVEC